MKKYKILILYTELAEYFLKCLIHTANHYTVDILLIQHDPHPDAPFVFKEVNNTIRILNKSNYTSIELDILIENFTPNIIYVTGWSDYTYLKIAFKYKKKLPVILGLDNNYNGSFKQILNITIFKYILKLFFNHVWVPGISQYHYARLLNFSHNDIMTGLYCADTELFKKFRESNNKKNSIIYIGRFVKYKFVKELYEIFNEIILEGNFNWDLIMIGNGPEKKYLKDTQNIKIINFQQPEELIKYTEPASVFCIPSITENWGVVLHEFVSAGKLILASDGVASTSDFIIDNYNGFLFKSGDKNSLKETLKKIMNLPDNIITEMCQNSKILANRINHDVWSAKFLSVLNKNCN